MPTPQPRNLAARKALFVLLLALIALAIGYSLVPSGPWIVPEQAKQVKNPILPSAAALESARTVYSEKCANCHGDTGKGDGHDASRHDPRPTNFTDATKTGAETDGELFYKIGEGHRPMPSFKKRLTDQSRWRLVLLIRSFAAPSVPPAQSGGAPAADPTPAGKR
jgi:mono/diheme cytochrome c family protein